MANKMKPVPGRDTSNQPMTNAEKLIKKEIAMKTNNSRISTWDRIMMAITFAEAGEHDTARELLKERQNIQRPETRNEKFDQRPELRA